MKITVHIHKSVIVFLKKEVCSFLAYSLNKTGILAAVSRHFNLAKVTLQEMSRVKKYQDQGQRL